MELFENWVRRFRGPGHCGGGVLSCRTYRMKESRPAAEQNISGRDLIKDDNRQNNRHLGQSLREQEVTEEKGQEPMANEAQRQASANANAVVDATVNAVTAAVSTAEAAAKVLNESENNDDRDVTIPSSRIDWLGIRSAVTDIRIKMLGGK